VSSGLWAAVLTCREGVSEAECLTTRLLLEQTVGALRRLSTFFALAPLLTWALAGCSAGNQWCSCRSPLVSAAEYAFAFRLQLLQTQDLQELAVPAPLAQHSNLGILLRRMGAVKRGQQTSTQLSFKCEGCSRLCAKQIIPGCRGSGCSSSTANSAL